MAKIKMGQIVADARGKVAGLVFSKNAYGAYVRQKVSPINPQNAAQTKVRSYFAAASQAWKGLSAVVRQGFTNAVSDWKRTNVFGDSQTLSGFNLYVKLHKTALDIVETPLTAYAGNAAPVSFNSLSVVSDNSDQSVLLTFAPAIAVGAKVKVYATPPYSPGKTFVKSEYRQIALLSSADVSGIDVGTNYADVFGAVGSAGQKVSVKLVPVLKASMREGQQITASTVIVS